MIRRELATGSTQRWMLIAQIEHARLAGEIARQWSAARGASSRQDQQVLSATYHHDDGWEAWDAAPRIDPSSGRPYSFMEMPLTDSLAIWRRSIERNEMFGPLAAAIVAGHFLMLLSGSSSIEKPAARAWVAEFEQRRDAWLARWYQAAPDEHTPAAARRARDYLRHFDALSLWLCCAPRSEPQAFSTPAGEVTIKPLSAAETEQRFSIEPWPLSLERLRLNIFGERVPARRYRDWRELATAERTDQVLSVSLESC